MDDLINDLVDHSESIKRNVNERHSRTSADISEHKSINQKTHAPRETHHEVSNNVRSGSEQIVGNSGFDEKKLQQVGGK